MRKKIFVAVLFLTLLCCGGKTSAQGFIGGSFGISTSRSGGTSASLTVAPNFGWYLTDKWAVGIMPSLGFTANTSLSYRNLRLGATPYAMYRLVDYERLGLWLEGTADMSYLRNWFKKAGPVNHSISYGVHVIPAFTFELDSHLVMMASFNMLSLGAHGVSTYNSESGTWNTSTNFGLSASDMDLASILSDISLGFLFRF